MSDTPRTDAARLREAETRTGVRPLVWEMVPADLARDLERELAALKAQLNEKNAVIDQRHAEIRRLREFAELWYFAMDESPREFERIVAEFPPCAWMNEIAKFRGALTPAAKGE